MHLSSAPCFGHSLPFLHFLLPSFLPCFCASICQSPAVIGQKRLRGGKQTRKVQLLSCRLMPTRGPKKQERGNEPGRFPYERTCSMISGNSENLYRATIEGIRTRNLNSCFHISSRRVASELLAFQMQGSCSQRGGGLFQPQTMLLDFHKDFCQGVLPNINHQQHLFRPSGY